MVKYRKVQIRQIGQHWAQQKAFFRFLGNEEITESQLIGGVTSRVYDRVAHKQVLSIQDSSELHYHRHASRIKDSRGLGDCGRSPLGYYIHPSLVVDVDEEQVMGLSDIHLWNRDIHRQGNTSDRKRRAIEHKESYKWIIAAERSKAVLRKARQVTIIQDRDGDIYESFARVPDRQTHLLIRSKTDRRIIGPQKWLYESLSAQRVGVVYELPVKDNKKRQSRKAHIEVKYGQVCIKRPEGLAKSYPPYIKLWAIQARERASTVPRGEAPIHWRLLTTHEVEDFTQAVQLIHWYSLRWLIEDFFRVLKTKGFQLESSELGSGRALRKLGILTMQAATQVMQLRQAISRPESAVPIDLVFDQQRQECLRDLLPTLEGKTDKLKNPFPDHLLSWGSWIIARLGGWSGYSSQRPPGVITLTNGLGKFEAIFLGWAIAQYNHKSKWQDSNKKPGEP